MNEWYALIQQFAIQRIDEIERYLLAHPEEYTMLPVLDAILKAHPIPSHHRQTK